MKPDFTENVMAVKSQIRLEPKIIRSPQRFP